MRDNAQWGAVWEKVEAQVIDSPLILVFGAVDSGKSTLVTRWASALWASGRRCAVVDADVGQSDIGPPGTVGMGLVSGVLRSLMDVKPAALHFVGALSPRGRALECLVGVQRMVARALQAKVDHILVDTTGFLSGSLGRALKLHKVEALNPDLVVCLQRERELLFVERAFRGRSRPRFLLLTPPPEVRRRSPAERARHREAALDSYMAGAALRRVDLKGMALFQWPVFQGEPLGDGPRRDFSQRIGTRLLWGETQGERLVLVAENPLGWRQENRSAELWNRGEIEVLTRADMVHRVVGVEAPGGEVLAIGVLEAIDFQTQDADLWIPRGISEIGGLRYGDMILTPDRWQASRSS